MSTSSIHPEEFECKARKFNIDDNSFLPILEELGVKYSFIDGDRASVASAISLQLDCPLIDSDPLLYVISCSSSNDIPGKLKFCPISGVQFSHYPLNNERSSYFVESHLFNPCESILSSLPPDSCRVFSALWGASLIPQLDFPQDVIDIRNVKKKNIVHAATKVINWLAEVGPVKAIESVMSPIGDKALKDTISKYLLYSINQSKFDFEEASLILKELGLIPVIDLDGQGIKASSDSSSSLRSSECNLSHWPSRMIKAYRRGFICPFLLSAIRSDFGKIFSSPVDFISSLSSSFIKAFPVRFLHYCLLYTFERSIEFNHVHSNIIEIHPFKADTVEVISLPLQNIQLSESEFNRDFIYRSFSYSPNKDLPDWLNVFSLSLLIWLKQSSYQCSPDESPIILSVALCALAHLFNSNEYPEDVLIQYQNVSEKFRNEYESTGNDENSLPECQQAQQIMLALIEIQNIYNELIALGKMLAALNFYHGSVDLLENIDEEFRPCFKVFPSNKLMYWLVKRLYALPSEQRCLTAIRVLFPQLMIRSESRNVSALIVVLDDLYNLLHHLQTAEIELVNTGQVKAKVPIKKISEITKRCANVREILESFLPVEKIKLPEKRPDERESSTTKKRTVRKNTNKEYFKPRGSSRPRQPSMRGSSTPKEKSIGKYADTLKSRYGVLYGRD